MDNEELKAIRQEIDEIDIKMTDLFVRRIKCAEEAGKIKKKLGRPLTDNGRENIIISEVSERAGKYGEETRELFLKIIELSKKREL